ncbi:FAD-dependent oxidoreductase [Aliamphritea ceti]|uniref:FAD-dependent oxidoreductase n=1 Tax=Aliamphritea ceti TaxID=1524258 RepID=UPI0021C26C0F|nr:FAD-dependent oxidoreductase [Aliamphritea ceti]
MQTINSDLIILGGGIAGLWLLNRLQQQGYNVILLESDELGGGQSIRSQGIIHGGTKYALNGALTQAANAIADMPKRWHQCLQGNGEIDLSQAEILSKAHYLWSKGSLASKMTTFFASKALKGRVDDISPEDRPEVFQHKKFRGSLYKLNELVLNVPSVISALSKPYAKRVFKVSRDDLRIISHNGEVEAIELPDKKLRLTAQRYILTAGEGSEQLLQQWKIPQPEMQRRPLHMVVVRHSANLPVFAHCIGAGSKPLVTITSHPTTNGEQAWYLGGDLAETGVQRSAEEQIIHAKKLLQDLLPWIELPNARWATLRIDRAEPKQSALTRPDSAFAQAVNNGIIGWPTKLALAPDMSDQILKLLDEQGVKPITASTDIQLPGAQVAEPVWETLF